MLTVLSAALFGAFAIAALALLAGIGLVGWLGPLDVPLWIALALLLAVYLLVALPVGLARRTALRYANGGREFGAASVLAALLWIAVVAVMVALAAMAIPGLLYEAGQRLAWTV